MQFTAAAVRFVQAAISTRYVLRKPRLGEKGMAGQENIP
jgi:hypothetical protein